MSSVHHFILLNLPSNSKQFILESKLDFSAKVSCRYLKYLVHKNDTVIWKDERPKSCGAKLYNK